MNEFYKGVITSLLTKALTGVSVYLVTNGWLSNEQTTQIVLGVSGLLASIIWTFYSRYSDALLKNAALQLTDPKATMEDAKALAKTDSVAPATLPTDVAPRPVSTTEFKSNVAKGLLLAFALGSATFVAACGKPPVVLVAEGGTVASGFIEQASNAVEAVREPNGPVKNAKALEIQNELLSANSEIKKLIPILKAVDAAQQAGDPTAGNLDAAFALVQSVSTRLNLVVRGVPVAEAAAKLLEVVNNARGAIATVQASLEKLRARRGADLMPSILELERLMAPAVAAN